jgi:parvulin-like peptidyl-prolyl isomerase
MFSRRSFVFVGFGLAGVRHAWAQQAADGVDGEPIMESDIRNRLRLLELSSATRKAPPREAVMEELREDRRILQEAKSRGIEIADADVDEAVAQTAARLHMTVQHFSDLFAKIGLDVGAYRERLRVQLTRKALGPPP